MKKKIIIVALLSVSLLSLSACNNKHSESKGKEAKTEQKETVKDSADFLVGQWKMEDKDKSSDQTLDFGALHQGSGKVIINGEDFDKKYTPNDFLDKDGYREVNISNNNETTINSVKYKLINKNKIKLITDYDGVNKDGKQFIYIRK